MTARRKMTKKRFAPAADAFFISSSDTSGLLSDSDEDATLKQEQDVARPQRLVHGDKTVGHLGSNTSPHDTNNIFISVTSLPCPAVSKLSEQQDEQQAPKDMRNDSRRNKGNNKESHGRPKELKINLKNMNMTASFSSNEDGLVVSQRLRSSTSQKNGYVGPAKNVLTSSEDSIHILTDSEEEVIETQSNYDGRTQRTGTRESLLLHKNSQQSPVNSNDAQINTVPSVHQGVVTSTPLRETVTPASVTSSLPSPITPAMSLSTVKTRRGKGSPGAKSEKMIVSAQKDLGQAAVAPGCYEEIKEKDNDNCKKLRKSSRKGHTPKDCEAHDDQEHITILSLEKHRELKSGVPANLLERSSSRVVSAQKDLDQATVVPGSSEEIEEKDDDSNKHRRSSRKLYTLKDYEGRVDQEDTVIFSAEKQSEIKSGLSANLHGGPSSRFKITTTSRSTCDSRKSLGLRSRKAFGKNQITIRAEVHAEESAYDGRRLPPNHRVEENAQDINDDKNSMASSNNDEIKHQNKRARRSRQAKKTSKMEPNEIPDLRRSTRQRVKPLEYWRGERIKYKIGADRCREVAGIDPGFPSRQWVRPPERPDYHQKKRIQFPEKDDKETYSRKLVLVPYGNGKCELECFSTVRIGSDVAEYMEDNFTVYTGLEVPGMSAGYVEIGPFCESCSVIDSNLVFHILIGRLTVTIHETRRNVRKGEFFFVPKGVSHTLRNDGEVKALLVFTKYGD